jgi:O-antigen ligase
MSAQTNNLEINMYIGGGILGTILVLALIFYVVRRA